MILVTGATGTVGSAVVNALHANNETFKALTRSAEKAAEFKSRGIEAIISDLADPDGVVQSLEGIDKVFLLSVNSPEQPHIFERFINECKQRPVSHVVNLSGVGSDPESTARISRNQGITDAFLRTADIDYTILSASFFMQNMLWQAQTIKDQNAFYLPMKDASVGTIDVRDIADVALEALANSQLHANKTYTLTGPEAISFKQIADKFSDMLGREIAYVDVPPELFTQGLSEAGQPDWNAEAVTEIFVRLANGEFEEVMTDVRDITGRDPRTFDDFAKDMKDAFS